MPDNSSQHKQLLETTRRELRQTRLELDAMQTEIDNLEIKRVKYQEDIADIQKKRSRLQTELNNLSSQSAQHQRQLTQAQRDYASVRTQRDHLQTELNRLETALASRKQDMARTQQDYADAQTKRNSLQTEINSLQNQLTAVKSEIAQNKKKHPAWMLVLLIALGLGHVINIVLAGPASFRSGLPFRTLSRPTGTPTDIPSATLAAPSVLPTQSTGTPAVESTPLPVPRVKADAAIRRGPSDRFEVVATAEAGAEIKPVAQSHDGSWVQLSLGLWLPARTIDHLPALPVARNIPALPAASADPPAPAATIVWATVNTEYGANLREGPGTNFDSVRVLEPGERVNPIARTRDGTWVQLDEGWIYAQLLDDVPDSLPVAQDRPTLP